MKLEVLRCFIPTGRMMYMVMQYELKVKVPRLLLRLGCGTVVIFFRVLSAERGARDRAQSRSPRSPLRLPTVR